MKKFHFISWAVFILGLIFRLLHYPGTGPLSLLGTLLLFIHSVIYLFKNARTNLPNVFVNLTFSMWTIYLLFRFQYRPFAQIISIAALLISLTCLIIHLVKRPKIRIPQIILSIYLIFSMTISYVHSDRIYYFFNLNLVINGENRNTDYYSWDKYSWFLYIAGKPDEAAEANKNAQKAVSEWIKKVPGDNTDQDLEMIKKHGQQIQEGNWIDYP